MSRLQYQFRPLSNWTGPKHSAQSSQFRAHWDDTIRLLSAELSHLRARNVVIQADIAEGDVRLDGMLRADAKPRSPAVVVSFDSKHGPLSYPCARFSNWKDNVRAIALALQALRAVDRYGVTRKAEQYKGWQSLPAPAAPVDFQSATEAAQFLAELVDASVSHILSDRSYRDAIYRRACLLTHPDHHPERANDFKRVDSAYRRLQKDQAS